MQSKLTCYIIGVLQCQYIVMCATPPSVYFIQLDTVIHEKMYRSVR